MAQNALQTLTDLLCLEIIYFCHQNLNAKNTGNFMTLLKPHNNIGIHFKGTESV
jgi:hypothetical protein